MEERITEGCESCRNVVLSGSINALPKLGENFHSRGILRRCRECQAFWAEHEGEAQVIAEAEARVEFPAVFDPEIFF